MRIGAKLVLATGAAALMPVAAGEAAPQRKPPYYASISAGKARMRTGPGRNYPASWLYVRADLPIKVVDIYQSWRKVEDPDGTQGWMQVNLLSDRRTAMVMGTIAELHATPDFGSRVVYRAAPGVIGRISKCRSNWCYIDVRGRGGYVEQSRLYGTDPGETVE